MDTNKSEIIDAAQELIEVEEHIALLTEEIERTPDSVDYLMQRAEYYRTQGGLLFSWHISNRESVGTLNLEEANKAKEESIKLAIEDYNKVLQLEISHAAAYYNRAALLYGLEKFDEAFKDIEKAVEYHFEPLATAHLLQANLLITTGQYEVGLQVINRVIARSATLSTEQIVSVYASQARAYRELKDFSKAVRSYQYLLIKLGKENPDDFINSYLTIIVGLGELCKLLIREGKILQAVSFISSCLPYFPDTIVNNASFTSLFILDVIIPIFKHAFNNLTSKDIQLLMYGNLPLEYTSYVSLVQSIQKRGNEEMVNMLGILANQACQEKGHDDPVRLAVTSLLVHLSPITGLIKRAQVYMLAQKPDYPCAIRDLRDYIALKPKNPEALCRAYMDLARCHNRREDHELAIAYYTTAIETCGDKIGEEILAKLYDERASIYYDPMRLYQQAIDDYTVAMRLDHASYISSLSRRAHCYSMLGNREQAMNDYQKLVQLEPDNEYYRKWLDQLMNNDSQR